MTLSKASALTTITANTKPATHGKKLATNIHPAFTTKTSTHVSPTNQMTIKADRSASGKTATLNSYIGKFGPPVIKPALITISMISKDYIVH